MGGGEEWGNIIVQQADLTNPPIKSNFPNCRALILETFGGPQEQASVDLQTEDCNICWPVPQLLCKSSGEKRTLNQNLQTQLAGHGFVTTQTSCAAWNEPGSRAAPCSGARCSEDIDGQNLNAKKNK